MEQGEEEAVREAARDKAAGRQGPLDCCCAARAPAWLEASEEAARTAQAAAPRLAPVAAVTYGIGKEASSGERRRQRV